MFDRARAPLRWMAEALTTVASLAIHTGAEIAGRLLNVGRLIQVTISPDDSRLITHREKPGNRAAILFVHGFSAHPEQTWGRFADLLAGMPPLDVWDIYSLGYTTGMAPDVRGIWAADPDITTLATYLRTRASVEPLARYEGLAVIAHSMGGLVAQKAIIDDASFTERVTHLIMFGTPSDGLEKARWGGFLKPQIRDMARQGEFVTALRAAWNHQFGTDRPFRLVVVAGDRDVFVPVESSLDPFPTDTHIVIPGNHLEMTIPGGSDSMGVQVVANTLVGRAAPAGPWNSARVAIEHRRFRQAIKQLAPYEQELDDEHRVALALALDEVGERERAISLLQGTTDGGTDVAGTLAGRHKRNWMATGKKSDARAALELYRNAYRAAVSSGDPDQAAYLAVNVAFLELAFEGDRIGASETASAALDHASRARPGYWRDATAAEARLYLGDTEGAIDGYRAALAAEPPPRAIESMYAQASWIADRMGDAHLQVWLPEVFRSEPVPVG